MPTPPNGQTPPFVPPQAPANVPFLPPWNPYVMPPAIFDGIINKYGIRLLWQKSHLCACTYSSAADAVPGSPDPACQTCFGRGYYWDSPVGPFVGLITFMHLSPSPDEPGAVMDTKVGMVQRSEPTLTIPLSAGVPFLEAGLNDIFVEIDTLDRFSVELKKGLNTTVPYTSNLLVSGANAVTVYDTDTHRSVFVSGYTVSGTSVELPSSYPDGTGYIVEMQASKAYVAWRMAGSTQHQRPFGAGGTGSMEPKRMHLQTLDLWLRGKAFT